MIQAKMNTDSLCPQGNRLSTLEVVMPRIVLAEFNTHRMFSRNSASSRAIPFKRMVKLVMTNPFIPMAWMKDHSGMQGSEYITNPKTVALRIGQWLEARDAAVTQAEALQGQAGSKYGGNDYSEEENAIPVTKQIANRLLEPFMWHKVLVSATEWENFFNLRDHEAAEIHIQAVARAIRQAKEESTPRQLQPGQWHIPFADTLDHEGIALLMDKGLVAMNFRGAEEAQLKIAVARCARLSYQTLGDDPKIDYEADLRLHDTLLASGHYSPFEHVARAMTEEEYFNDERGIGLSDERAGWSNNFRGFIQYRKLVS